MTLVSHLIKPLNPDPSFNAVLFQKDYKKWIQDKITTNFMFFTFSNEAPSQLRQKKMKLTGQEKKGDVDDDDDDVVTRYDSVFFFLKHANRLRVNEKHSR